MREERSSIFRGAERFLLDFALLLMLAVGLCRVVLPEVREVFGLLLSEKRPVAAETVTKGGEPTEGRADLSGGD
jgi:hypothetical protein